MVWTDTEWVRQLKQEDEQALQALWELLYRTSLKLTWRYNCSQQDAEDAAARAYHLVLTRGLAQFRYQSKFSTYCHTIIVREMGKVCRHKNRETSIEGDPRLERTLSTPPPIPSANIAAVRARLSEEAFATALAAGRKIPLEAAIADALDEAPAP